MNVGYEIWAVRCGRIPDFPVSGIHASAHNGGILDLPFGFLVCRNRDRIVLIDCGFDIGGSSRSYAETAGVVESRSAVQALASLGVEPGRVTDVILTHLHWDHAGGLAAFSEATVHLQERELSEWRRLLAGPPSHAFLVEAIDPNDVAQVSELSARAVVRFHHGETIGALPGVDLIDATDTHTPGSQCVAILDNVCKTWVAAGDCVMSAENLTGLVPGVYSPISGVHGSRERLFDLYDRIVSTVDGDLSRVIAVHDARTWTDHPTLAGSNDMIAALAVR